MGNAADEIRATGHVREDGFAEAVEYVLAFNALEQSPWPGIFFPLPIPGRMPA